MSISLLLTVQFACLIPTPSLLLRIMPGNRVWPDADTKLTVIRLMLPILRVLITNYGDNLPLSTDPREFGHPFDVNIPSLASAWTTPSSLIRLANSMPFHPHGHQPFRSFGLLTRLSPRLWLLRTPRAFTCPTSRLRRQRSLGTTCGTSATPPLASTGLLIAFGFELGLTHYLLHSDAC